MYIETFIIQTKESISQQDLTISLDTSCESVLESLSSILHNQHSFAVYEAEWSHTDSKTPEKSVDFQCMLTFNSGICYRKLLRTERISKLIQDPICIRYNWHTTQNDQYCFVIKDQSLISPYIDLRNELAGSLPKEAIASRLQIIQIQENETRLDVMERHQKQVSELQVRMI